KVRRQYRMNGAPGELAVPDLTAAGSTDTAGLADREGREIVVQQECLLVGALQRIDELLVLAGAERRDHQSLRLAACEQRRTVGARQHADLAHDRPHGLHVAAVDAFAGVEDVPAYDLALEFLEHAADLLRRIFRVLAALRAEMAEHAFLDGVDRLVARGLFRD